MVPSTSAYINATRPNELKLLKPLCRKLNWEVNTGRNCACATPA